VRALSLESSAKILQVKKLITNSWVQRLEQGDQPVACGQKMAGKDLLNSPTSTVHFETFPHVM